jgi:hypothetical protein
MNFVYNCFLSSDYIVTVPITVTIIPTVTIVTNDHLQLSAYNKVTETTRLFKHEERYNRYNVLGAQVTGTM